MAEDDNLVPVFIPPLAQWLAQAEKVKGSPLSESEVLRIRDKASCIMMSVAHAQKMAESRGFHDVEPENCWADWHRLRTQMTGNGYLPRMVLCVLGHGDLPKKTGSLLQAEEVEHEWREHDPRMVESFKASACRIAPSLLEEDFEHIERHAKVLYVLSPNFTAQNAPFVSRAFLRLGRRLLQSGGLALKCESSGIAHGRVRWLELSDEAEGDDYLPALLRAFVQFPIRSRDDYCTCGLHLIGKPDLIISDTVLRQSLKKPWAVVELFQVFALYLLTECSEGKFASGHTFSADAESPRFRVLWEHCTGYAEDDFFFNPFGRWRFHPR